MSQLGTLITGAGVQTTFAGQAQCEQFVLIGDVDTAFPLRGLSIEIDGTPYINIQNSLPLMTAFAQWQMENSVAIIPFLLKLGTGMIAKSTTYRFTNDGATTPDIFVYSEAQDGIPVIATTKGINASSYEDFSKFSALFVTVPADVTSIEIVFEDGYKATMTAAEAASLFAFKYGSEANGLLTAVLVIDNTDRSIKTVRIFADPTGLTVLVAKLPNLAFKDLVAETE